MITKEWIGSYATMATMICCLFGLGGCKLTTTATVIHPDKLAQTEEMDWAPPLKLRIVQCYWAKSVSKMDDYLSQGNSMPAFVADQMNVNAQDTFLVVELAITNYGTQPMSSREAPVFELRSPSGLRFGPNPGMDRFSMDFPLAGNINPGRARTGRVVFDVPQGPYDLYVRLGQPYMNAMTSTNKLAGIWELSPADGK